MLQVEHLSAEEQIIMLHEAIVARLYQNPHCWLANLMGRRLADLLEQKL
jgi:hypothetical protein